MRSTKTKGNIDENDDVTSTEVSEVFYIFGQIDQLVSCAARSCTTPEARIRRRILTLFLHQTLREGSGAGGEMRILPRDATQVSQVLESLAMGGRPRTEGPRSGPVAARELEPLEPLEQPEVTPGQRRFSVKGLAAIRRAAKKRWAREHAQKAKRGPGRPRKLAGVAGWWAGKSKKERSEEMQRRMKVRLRKQKAGLKLVA